MLKKSDFWPLCGILINHKMLLFEIHMKKIVKIILYPRNSEKIHFFYVICVSFCNFHIQYCARTYHEFDILQKFLMIIDT